MYIVVWSFSLVLFCVYIMGISMSKAWEPAEELGIFNPEPWPSQHTDQDGYVQPYQESGRYQNPWMKERASPLGFFLEYMFVHDYSNIPSSSQLIDKELPIVDPIIRNATEVADARMTWIGHASVLAEVDGVSVLTDPIFSDRCSAVSFAGPKRFRQPPLSQKQIPQIDAVVISHSHYDHLDIATVQEIAESRPECEFFVPKGLKSWMISNTVAGEERVKELSWWEEVPTTRNNQVKVAFTPANHWCKRTITDDNKVLWGSWAVIGPNNSFWFGGDTGYCEAFKQIGRKYGPFTMAAIPIGAYQPNWFMKHQHVHPGEAVEIHKDIQSKKSLGIHWGTFKLTTEYYLEPREVLKQWLNRSQLTDQEFVTTDIVGCHSLITHRHMEFAMSAWSLQNCHSLRSQ